MDDDVPVLGSILGVWAHPDDEAYLCAGLMAAARDAGHRVVSVTATLGEHGTGDPERWPPARLAPLRAAELVAALDVLGVDDARWLGYGDGGCATVPAAAAVERLVEVIREVQPDAILTFGPDGITGHPDHRAVGGWAAAAWREAGTGSRLLRAVTTDTFEGRFSGLHREIGVYEPGYPVLTPEADTSVLVRFEGPALERKLAALRAHATQTAGLIDVIGADRYAEWCAEEAFVEES